MSKRLFVLRKVPLCCCFTAVNSDETVNVTDVEFGNSEKLPFSEIRKLPDMFLRLPKQVIKLRCLISVMPYVRYGLISYSVLTGCWGETNCNS